MNWRESARKAIAKAVEEAKGLEGAALEKYVRANGYPFGERAMSPYKIWCSEVNRALKKPRKKEDLSRWFDQFKEPNS